MNWYPPEIDFIFESPHYWGPGETDFSLPGVNDLDRLARSHDIIYLDAPHSRQGRVQRMEADARLAKSAGGITGAYMTIQSGVRLLTMNLVPLPWD